MGRHEDASSLSSAPRIGRSVVLFTLDGRRFALPLAVVERVVRAVASTALPNSPTIVRGVIDVGGEAVPLLSLRHRFGLPDRPVRAADQYLIVRTHRRRVALIVDASDEVIEDTQPLPFQLGPLADGMRHLPGVLRLDDSLVLIHDLDRCLDADESEHLENALRALGGSDA